MQTVQTQKQNETLRQSWYDQRDHWLRWVALLQGFYYLVTGLWAILSIETFQMITGPKTDLWLVKTVGLLVTVSGVVFLYSGFRRSFPIQVVLLAIGNALALTVIDIYYVVVGTISPVYLLDALAEIPLIMLWWGLYTKRQKALRPYQKEERDTNRAAAS